MTAVAKIFKHGGSQAVRLPKAFRFEGGEVEITKRGDEVILRPVPAKKFESLQDLSRYFKDNFPHAADFPDVPRPKTGESRDLTW